MTTRIIAALLAALLHAPAAVADYGSATVSQVTSIYDGDTFRADIAGWPAIIGERVPIRVKGVDAPEIRAHCDSEKRLARQAKQFTVAALRGADHIELEELERGKYFRIAARVMIAGEDLATELVAAGLGRPYQGGHRAGWCESVL
ncbi:thermonuclease family protein [Salinicola socius]|uniref:Nuclease n=1 Tax=Salinicola socius TaxID=404433 RepID=A0A1Q8SUK6_9GAMM|nr:thermonuclease family protein [Salinicola socius]OLO05096.1 nuclease [Salinicola socius]